jgi:hypothetical protein
MVHDPETGDERSRMAQRIESKVKAHFNAHYRWTGGQVLSTRQTTEVFDAPVEAVQAYVLDLIKEAA